MLLDISGHIKLTDFGLSKRLERHSAGQNKEMSGSREKGYSMSGSREKGYSMSGSREKGYSMCGTPAYMSPEVVCSKGHDFVSDWWSLGIFMYELSTGNPPFENSCLV